MAVGAITLIVIVFAAAVMERGVPMANVTTTQRVAVVCERPRQARIPTDAVSLPARPVGDQCVANALLAP